MQPRRHERVRELLRRAVGEVLRRETSVSQTGLITVNDVEIANDLHDATVYVSILGNETQKRDGIAWLNQEHKRLQTIVGHAVVLRYTPQLKFVLDDSLVRGDRVLAILEALEKPPPTS